MRSVEAGVRTGGARWSVWSGLTGVSGLWHLKGSEEERDREWVEFGRNRGRERKEGWKILQCLHQPLSSSINTTYSWEAGRGPLFCIWKIDREREQLPWPASSLCCCTHTCTHACMHTQQRLYCIKKRRAEEGTDGLGIQQKNLSRRGTWLFTRANMFPCSTGAAGHSRVWQDHLLHVLW